MDGIDTRSASRTAVLMCQGRAVADGRLAVTRFADPVAARLLRPDELAAVERARAEEPPTSVRERLTTEWLRTCAEVVVPRTVVIDDAVRDAGHGQVVIIGAGLDSRPWRLTELGETTVYAVDHPASQADARDRSAALTPLSARLAFVPVDLARESLDQALAVAGHDPGEPTTWVWEGVVPYLTRHDVDATVAALSARSAAGSVLAVNYQSPSLVATVGRRVAGLAARLSKAEDPLAGEPWRSLWTPQRMREQLARHGFVVRTDEDLLTVAARIGAPVTNRRSIGNGRVAVAARMGR
jgi:methyltransferase (TIGR00027 family)